MQDSGAEFYEAKGEAAFYGPKIDVQVRSALGHDVTLSTVQLDYQLPEKFELEYIDENNERVRPVVIHRAILGSLDRFVAFLLEETKGVLPLWLAPVQMEILPISDKFIDKCKDVEMELKKQGFRVELDERNEKIGYKIRSAISQKIPYILVMGENEINNGTVSVRVRGTNESKEMKIEEFISFAKFKLENRE